RGGGCRGSPPAVRPRAIGARSADRGERGFGRRGCTGADPVGGSGAISDHHRRADVHARWRAPRNRASSRAGGARRGAGGHTGGGAGVAGSRREAACLRGARCPLRGPGGGATAGDRARGSPGGVAVSGDEVTAEDVARVNEVARAVSLGRDHELLHDIPQEYVVDQQRGISDPVGMTGTRLEVEMYLVTVQSTAAQNLRRSVERARYRPAELVLEPLAASYAVLTDDEKELGVALVEVGGGSTGVAIFHEGKIRHLASLKYAGTHVTSDLVAGLGVTQADAER